MQACSQSQTFRKRGDKDSSDSYSGSDSNETEGRGSALNLFASGHV